jgi:plasmid stabilization system protein ParE
MQRYSICMTPEAIEDIENVYHYIADILMSQEIAINYYTGINDTIHRLAAIGGIFAVSQQESLQKQYGYDVRTINYKSMTIVYNLVGNIVIVRRVTPSKMVL